MHVHPMGFYSAVYYEEAPPEDAQDPQAGWLQFGPPDLTLPTADVFNPCARTRTPRAVPKLLLARDPPLRPGVPSHHGSL